MREAHPVERAVGIASYVSDADGIGGRLRAGPEDFRVREIEAVDAEPVDADPGAYPHVVVRATLRNRDTNDFAGALSDRLGISRERVSWAGTKDKRAVTTQLFSVDGVDPDDVPAGLRGAELSVVGRTGRPVLHGDLVGNEFEITVREPDEPGNAAAVTDELAAFAGAAGDDPESEDRSDGESGRRTVGVPDLFGQQRFGSRRPVTHEVGLALARGDPEGAVRAYVGNPSEREPAATREARTLADEGEWAAAIEAYPPALGHERAICGRLVENGADGPEAFRAALTAVPTNLQRLFVHAAQSYLFNRIVSERLARGLPFDRPVVGDVVAFADRDVDALAVPDTGRTQRVTDERLATVERHCERGRAFVTAPLVGTETELADGEPGEIERAVLEEAGLGPADFDLPGEFDSTGDRRAVLVRTSLAVDAGDDAVTFAFALPRGSYATVLLREYLKTDPGSY